MAENKVKRRMSERLPALVGLPQILLVVGLAIGLAVLIDFNRRLTVAQRLVNDATQVANEVGTLRAQRDILSTAKAYANSDQAVEDWARSHGKEVKPGEVIVVPLPPGGVTPTPQTLPTPTPVAVPNYQLWWGLYFDVRANP